MEGKPEAGDGGDSPFANSPFKDRTLDNVNFGKTDPLIVGPTRLQNKNDFDMTYEQIKKNKDLMLPMKVSDFGKDTLTKDFILNEYGVLDSLYDQEHVVQQLIQGKEYVQRNRYSDILAY